MTTNRISDYALFGGAALAMGAVGASDAGAQGVDGFYGGLSLGLADADNYIGNSSEYNFTGAAAGAFVGYNVSLQGFVVGGELSYVDEYKVDDNGGSFYLNMGLAHVTELRGRVGKVFGSTFAYGLLGYTKADAYTEGTEGVNSDAQGLSYGVGFEHPLGSNMFIGGEIVRQDLDVDDHVYVYDNSLKMDTASIRFGLRF